MVGVVVGYIDKGLVFKSKLLFLNGYELPWPRHFNLLIITCMFLPRLTHSFSRNEWWKPNDSIHMKKYFENLRVT